MSLVETLRKPKVFKMAIFDWVASFVVMAVLANIFNLDIVKTVLLVFPLSLVAHVAFMKNTKFLQIFKQNSAIQLFVGIITGYIIINF